MTKAKTIDRVEMTKRKFSMAQGQQQSAEITLNSGLEGTQEVKFTVRGDDEKRRIKALGYGLELQGLLPHPGRDICPRCGCPTLIHQEGCERCLECGYDACAWSEV